MSATFRFIYYSQDPFVGARYPIGSIVRQPDGRLEVARTGHLPTAECLGDHTAALGLRRLADQLDAIQTFDALPPVFGPYTLLGEERAVPAGVDDAVSWVQRLLARPALDPPTTRTPRGVQRSTVGYRFFETWQVARHVRKTFDPSQNWSGRLGRVVGLPPITHWTASKTSLLLMEPVVADRRQLASDISEIATRFLAYRYVLDGPLGDGGGQLYAYLPAGGSPARRAEARAALTDAAHAVFDTEDPDERDALLSRIRTVGESAGAQESLSLGTRH